MVEIPAVDEQSFDATVLASDRPVVVDFWAEWCPPCHQLSPVLAQVAAERAAELVVVKVNSDFNPRVAARYRVMGLPTLIMFHRGEPVWQVAGARSKSQLSRELDAALATLPPAMDRAAAS
jgi:thioredoxin 1